MFRLDETLHSDNNICMLCQSIVKQVTVQIIPEEKLLQTGIFKESCRKRQKSKN